MTTNILQFDPFSSSIDATFWMELANRKINHYKLNDAPVDVQGWYTYFTMSGTGSQSGTTESGSSASTDIPSHNVPARFHLSSSSFETGKMENGRVFLSGLLQNVNTFEEFKTMDKMKFLNHAGQQIWDDILDEKALENPNLLGRFWLLTFADLKKYKFFYWAAFPAIIPSIPFQLSSPAKMLHDVCSKEKILSLTESVVAFGNAQLAFLIRENRDGSYECAPLHEHKSFSTPSSQWIPDSFAMVYLDPSTRQENPGWSLRNILLLADKTFNLESLRVISFRLDPKTFKSDASLVFDVILPKIDYSKFSPSFTGWEMGTKGKPSPRLLDLSPLLDPKQLSETAVDLNLKLMRWRILPTINLEKISSTKCLLLGAGTLGCYVSRVLMGWGVRHISFVDYGKVSYSNPVRQPLFDIQDCVNGGKPKAETAAEALKRIFPAINSQGYSFSIPMPGHYESHETLKENVEKLTSLIQEHDVIFLLTDSRESRWLPTVIAATLSKAVITAALGFDTFVVMRHGVRRNPGESPQLGCYFCNDVVAPIDSMKDRTLDQQCTVSRPGLSSIASSIAVEMMVNTLSHPDEFMSDVSEEDETSGLGHTPHQIRGFLGQFKNLNVVGRPFDKCVACSTAVLNAYHDDGIDFITKAIQDPLFLENLTGLKKLHEDASAVDVDWDEDEGEDDI